MDREQLEALALKTVSATNYYDLADCIDESSDAELEHIISCGGDYEKEEAA